jgi:hypothetical protein
VRLGHGDFFNLHGDVFLGESRRRGAAAQQTIWSDWKKRLPFEQRGASRSRAAWAGRLQVKRGRGSMRAIYKVGPGRGLSRPCRESCGLAAITRRRADAEARLVQICHA